MINGTILILKKLIFHFLMEMILANYICFARVCSTLDIFNKRNKVLTFKFLKQGYRYHELCNAFFLNFITDTQSLSLKG